MKVEWDNKKYEISPLTYTEYHTFMSLYSESKIDMIKYLKLIGKFRRTK